MKLRIIAATAAFVAVAAAGGDAGAQPRIENATGEALQGSELRLSGTQFGIKNPVAPVLWDDFEGGQDGDAMCSGGTYNNGQCDSPWDEWYGYGTSMVQQPGGIFTYTDSLAVDGRSMCLQVFHPVDGNLQYLIKNFTPTGKLYFVADHKMRFPDFVSTQVKPMRFRTRSNLNRSIYAGRTLCDDDGRDAGASSGYGLDWISGPDLMSCIDGSSNMGWTKPDGWINWMDWITWEWILDEGSEGNPDTYSKVTYDTEVKNETWSLCALENGGGSYDQLILGGQASTMPSQACTGGSQIGCYTFWDNVYLDTTFQRIELGNRPVYADCTKRAIQLPTAWNGTEVVASVNMGTFGEFENLYAFVVDENNVPSNGFPVRIIDDPGPPGPPGQPIQTP